MVRIGDKVRFLNEVGGGIVTRFINKKTVEVENEDGFEIPMLISELVVIESASGKESTQKDVIQVKRVAEPEIEIKPKFIEGKDSPDFYLAFVPKNQKSPIESGIEAWFVNDSNFSLLYNFSFNVEGVYKSVKNGKLGSNSKILLESITQSEMVDLPDFYFQIIYYSEESDELYQPIVKKMKVNPVKFYKEKTFVENTFFEKNAWLLAVSDNMQKVELDKMTDEDFRSVIAQKEKQKFEGYNKPPRKKDKDLVEVDLHINELIDDVQGLSNHDILQLQIEKFNSELQQAIREGIKRIIFIHGVGQGALKTEIISELKKKYKKYFYQDASFKEYGYGATMVILREK